ncbi:MULTISPECIES: L,D-transpeptidase [Streptomyces]|uniref:L,D-transpeptidase n=1 Tax=Streptomyces solicathayae TaxID=3081768 RepID=A0ABZ0LNG0_9ACTN|nr:L,D-transpeptidase [Streptomyces sp. HUAS YS2]WOX20354.1 L,D-transpeptidase [Streptomyces sp. HUAS YS2]
MPPTSRPRFPLQLLAALIGFRVRDTAFATTVAVALEDTRSRPVLPVGLHGSGAPGPWKRGFGEPASHGCVERAVLQLLRSGTA